MVLDPSERASRRNPDPLDAELDALVAREVDALSVRRARPGVTRRVAEGKPDADVAGPQRGSQPEDADAARVDRADASARPAKVRPHDGNVIGIRRAVRNGKADGILFSAEEEAFIEQSVAFLAGRENADVIIEEIWTHSVLDRHDSLDDTRSDEALSPEQVDELGPDELPGEASRGPNGSGPATTAPHAVTAIQSGRGRDRSAVDTAGSSEALVPNAAPTPAPRAAPRPAPPQPSKPRARDDSTSDGATE